MKGKLWNISLLMKRGDLKKYKPILKWINKNYNPHYLSFNHCWYYDSMNLKPVPEISFKVYAYDAIHVLDDFIEKYSDQHVFGSAKPYKYIHTWNPSGNEKTMAKRLKKQFKESKND